MPWNSDVEIVKRLIAAWLSAHHTGPIWRREHRFPLLRRGRRCWRFVPVPKVSLDQILAHPTLPSLPAVAVEVLALASKPDANLEQIAKVIQHDQALSAKILRTVNSSFYALPSPCHTITRAISYLGLNTVKSLMLGFSLVDWSRFANDGFDLTEYWRRSIFAASATKVVVEQCRLCDPEESFTAALMQDVGMTAIHSAAGADYDRLIAEAADDHNRLAALEQEFLGFDHAFAGAKLLERWRLPAEMIESVRWHHHADNLPSQSQLVRAVALGTVAASPNSQVRFAECAQRWFSIAPERSGEMLGDITRQAKDVNRLFRIHDQRNSTDLNAIRAKADEISLQHQLTIQREAEDLRERNLKLAQMAVTDALTGVGNRKLFDTDVPAQFQRARCTAGCLALLMVDVDSFKALNDTHGHQVGDAVLIELAQRLQLQTPDHGFVCRYGGEEFAVVLPGSDRRDAARIAEALRLAVASTPIEVHQSAETLLSLNVTVSIGVAVLEPATVTRFHVPELLIRAADMALYAAKRANRNCVRVFTPQQQASAAA